MTDTDEQAAEIRAIVRDIREHPDAGVKLASLLGTAMTRPLTGVEVQQALDLISEIRRGA